MKQQWHETTNFWICILCYRKFYLTSPKNSQIVLKIILLITVTATNKKNWDSMYSILADIVLEVTWVQPAPLPTIYVTLVKWPLSLSFSIYNMGVQWTWHEYVTLPLKTLSLIYMINHGYIENWLVPSGRVYRDHNVPLSCFTHTQIILQDFRAEEMA